jgi:small subunit ribosomal protein S11
MKKSIKEKVKKRVVIVPKVGEAHIKATYNNVMISLTNKLGDVFNWSSGGKMGFKGAKKNTPYAAKMSANDCAKSAYESGLRKVEILVKGPGFGREAAIKTIEDAGIQVSVIKDVTPIPHNGCKPPKRKRP